MKERANLFIQAAKTLTQGQHITSGTILKSSGDINPELRELDEEISKIELATREMIVTLLSSTDFKNLFEVVPEKMVQNATSKYKSWLKKNPGYEEESPMGLKTTLTNLTISDYKDIILKKSNWPLFEPVFTAHGNVMTRFTQLATMRNKIRHDNELNKVERKDGEAAIEWFNVALMNYIA